MSQPVDSEWRHRHPTDLAISSAAGHTSQRQAVILALELHRMQLDQRLSFFFSAIAALETRNL